MSAVSSYRRQQLELRQNAVADARRLSELVERELQSDLDAAQSIASLPALDAPVDLETFAETGRRALQRRPGWLTVNLLDPQGQRLVNVRSGRLGPAADPASVRTVVETRRPVIGAIAMGGEQYGIPLRAPVIRDGRVTGVVSVVIRPDGVARAVAEARLPSSWIVTVVDGAGRVVARNRRAADFVGKPASAAALQASGDGQSGSYEGYTLDRTRAVSAFWKSPTLGWSVHVGIPREVFEAPLRRTVLITGAGFAGSLLLAAVFLSLLVRELRLRRREALWMEQSNRMEALGRLTGGVAHDFNNLLMIIQGNAEILQRRTRETAAQRPLTAIREATERAAKLTRELLVFARGAQAETTLVELNPALADFLPSIEQAIGSNIRVKAEFDVAAGWVDVDRVQFELAVLNLAVNARDAMPEGGVLSIVTRRLGPGEVELSVTDTGQGMAEEVRARIFDPFFTTKPPGVGTGLGLTQVYGFAKHARGSIEARSRPGRGTTMTLRLPAAEPSAVQAASSPAPEAAAPRLAGRRLLLLDDNAEVRLVTAASLREFGAEVVEGASVAEGLAALEGGGFDAVVSDIVMPGEANGLALAAEAARRWPGLPVLLVSGYSASLAEAVERGFRVLRKPYALSDLAAVLGELLGQAEARAVRPA